MGRGRPRGSRTQRMVGYAVSHALREARRRNNNSHQNINKYKSDGVNIPMSEQTGNIITAVILIALLLIIFVYPQMLILVFLLICIGVFLFNPLLGIFLFIIFVAILDTVLS